MNSSMQRDLLAAYWLLFDELGEGKTHDAPPSTGQSPQPPHKDARPASTSRNERDS